MLIIMSMLVPDTASPQASENEWGAPCHYQSMLTLQRHLLRKVRTWSGIHMSLGFQCHYCVRPWVNNSSPAWTISWLMFLKAEIRAAARACCDLAGIWTLTSCVCMSDLTSTLTPSNGPGASVKSLTALGYLTWVILWCCENKDSVVQWTAFQMRAQSSN